MPYFERGRPPELEDGKTINLYLSASLIDEAKKMGINISEVCREALSIAIKSPIHKLRNEITKKLEIVPILMRKKIKRRIMEDQKTSERWSAWIKEKHEIEITPEELQIFAGYNV